MRLSGFRLLNNYADDTEFDNIKELFQANPKAVIEVYVHAPSDAGLMLIPKIKYTLKNHAKEIVYSFDFANRVYKWLGEEIYLTRHEEVALYAHMHCKADIYWGVAVRTIRQRLGAGFMSGEEELEVDCKICN